MFQKLETILAICHGGGKFYKLPAYSWSTTDSKDDYWYIKGHWAGWISKAAGYLRSLSIVKSLFMVYGPVRNSPFSHMYIYSTLSLPVNCAINNFSYLHIDYKVMNATSYYVKYKSSCRPHEIIFLAKLPGPVLGMNFNCVSRVSECYVSKWWSVYFMPHLQAVYSSNVLLSVILRLLRL